jgi:alanine racemase
MAIDYHSSLLSRGFMARPSRALIDLSALRQNYRLACNLAPNSRNIAVVKANAYGHGAETVARTLETDVPAFAVAYMEEALKLRAFGISKPILVMEGFFTEDELPLAVEHNFWLMIENPTQVETLTAAKLKHPVTVWLKIDTGMHRLGAALDRASSLFERLESSANVNTGIVFASHFACADELQNDFTNQQIQQLRQLARRHKAPLSMANSPALLAWPQSHGDWNRPGYMLYGSSPFFHHHEQGDKLTPVMSFESQVISLREVSKGDTVGYGATWKAERASVIATIPVGYGDGYPRNAPSGTPVLVNGQMAPLAGRVSMDLITVDVTAVPHVAIGTKVELWGKQLGVNHVASAAGTIGYELLTRMPARLPRVYIS